VIETPMKGMQRDRLLLYFVVFGTRTCGFVMVVFVLLLLLFLCMCAAVCCCGCGMREVDGWYGYGYVC